jgi:putative acyl-CoA dehydrogenase
MATSKGGVLGRLFREAPVNSIWEGSGNIMCLDVLRGISRQPASARLLLDDLFAPGAGRGRAASGGTHAGPVAAAGAGSGSPGPRLCGADWPSWRRLHCCVDQPPSAVADAFIASRYAPHWGGVTGQMHLSPAQARSVLQRALAD